MATDPWSIKEADRIVLISMGSDPPLIPAGATGTVTFISRQGQKGQPGSWVQVSVLWDADTRGLMLTLPPDEVEVVDPTGGVVSGARVKVVQALGSGRVGETGVVKEVIDYGTHKHVVVNFGGDEEILVCPPDHVVKVEP